jgi:glycosyltransferase involved in cell wall biosynthesis
VIGYRGNGLSDFIVDGVDGVLVAGAEQMADALVCLIGRPDALRRLRKSTTTTPPSVGPKQALDAVADLYRRARALPERAGPAVTP